MVSERGAATRAMMETLLNQLLEEFATELADKIHAWADSKEVQVILTEFAPDDVEEIIRGTAHLAANLIDPREEIRG